MRLEDQVISLEKAVRIKELGIIQDSKYYWRSRSIEHVDSINSWGDQETLGDMIKRNDKIWSLEWRDEYEVYSAFTVSEMAAMIGRGTNASTLLYDAVQDQMNRSHSFTICYSPDFMANCLISLIETGRITAEECNKRLTSK